MKLKSLAPRRRSPCQLERLNRRIPRKTGPWVAPVKIGVKAIASKRIIRSL
ncbi:hypothetical protein J0895_05835 [Phormidium pseudopriestleyi FRX01]|uniref:Uncharacterized protein n=1 Tax=Phormidium pseudopriestleyi FRX01 TaxID=1759528 RepID=A0ABS3FND7_9CYAN|nr:hypothetical protein [Phormidium pseudopriestleyi]MBO0348630.1 hypothetical protein [Phormidium pseudopriestleyi FRX01]